MQLRSAPNKVRTVDMSETPVREIITKHVHELFGGASVRALAVLVADYVYCLIGRRRQRLTLATDFVTQLNGISTSRLEFFPESGKCEWLARNGAHVSSTYITCDANWCFHAGNPYFPGFREGDVDLRPKPGVAIRRNARLAGFYAAYKIVILDTSLPSRLRVETVLSGWPAPRVSPVYSDGLGTVYRPTEDRVSPLLDIEIRGWDSGLLSTDTEHIDGVPVLGYYRVATLAKGTLDHSGMLTYFVVDELGKRLWISTEEEDAVRRCHLYCFDISDSYVPKVLFQTTWKNDTRVLTDDRLYWVGKVNPTSQVWTDVFAVSHVFRLFAILQRNGLLSIHCADTFCLIQDLDTGISDQFTSVVNFRFLDFQDTSCGGPVLAFLVETRPSAERNAPRSYDLRVFMC